MIYFFTALFLELAPQHCRWLTCVAWSGTVVPSPTRRRKLIRLILPMFHRAAFFKAVVVICAAWLPTTVQAQFDIPNYDVCLTRLGLILSIGGASLLVITIGLCCCLQCYHAGRISALLNEVKTQDTLLTVQGMTRASGQQQQLQQQQQQEYIPPQPHRQSMHASPSNLYAPTPSQSSMYVQMQPMNPQPTSAYVPMPAGPTSPVSPPQRAAPTTTD